MVPDKPARETAHSARWKRANGGRGRWLRGTCRKPASSVAWRRL